MEFKPIFFDAKIPTKNSLGYDIYAYDSIFLYPRGRCVISSGVQVNYPNGIKWYLVPVNDDLEKYGIDILNGFDYSQNDVLRVIMINHSDEKIFIKRERVIAKLILNVV